MDKKLEYGSEEWKNEIRKTFHENQEVYELSLTCSKAELGRVMQVIAWMNINIEGCFIIGNRRSRFTLEQMKSVSAFYLIRMHPDWIDEFKKQAQLKEWQLRPASVAITS